MKNKDLFRIIQVKNILQVIDTCDEYGVISVDLEQKIIKLHPEMFDEAFTNIEWMNDSTKQGREVKLAGFLGFTFYCQREKTDAEV